MEDRKLVWSEGARKFLGQGWRYPVSLNGRGGIAMSRAGDDIQAAILIILGTARGERVMRPEFGSSIHEFVYAPNSATTHGLIAYHVREALGQWEPRIDVLDVDVQADIADSSRVLINIVYEVIATNDVRNLVYPFYLVPLGEE